MCVCLFHGRWWQFLKYSESYERRLSHSQDSFSRCEFPSVKSTFHVCTESHDPSERNCIPLQLCKDPCRGKGHAAETTSLKLPLESETERERLRMSKRDWSTRGVQQLCVFLPSLYLTIVYVPILKSRHITLPTKVHLVKAKVFPVVMYGCASWTIKKAEHQRIYVVFEKTLESPLDCKEIQPVHPKGNQSWICIGRAGVEAETPMLWPPDAKSWLIWKDPNAGKDWRWEEKGTREDEMVGWHHWLNGHEFW